jgi:hypothetical protein
VTAFETSSPSSAPSLVAMSELVPKRVVAAIIAQLALTAVDIASLATVAFGILGMTQATGDATPSADPDADLILGLMVIGYGLSSSIGLVLGIASTTALYRGATWGRSAAIAHGIVTILSCCPCNWAMAVLAMVAANHPDVRAWPAIPARDLVDTFR